MTTEGGASAGKRRERFRGAVIGQCLGDALGFVVEGYPPEYCLRYVNEYLRGGRAGEVGRGQFPTGQVRHIPFGQYTDDSQLMREMLQSFVARRGFDPADYARRVGAIFAENRIVGRGMSTESAARRILAGVPWRESGTPSPSAGNGSAMRAAAVGLMFADDLPSLVSAARDQSLVTHADDRCLAGSIAIAAATARGIRGEEPEVREFCADLADRVRDTDAGTARFLEQLPGLVLLPPDQAADPIRAAGVDPSHGDPWPGISPFVTSSVLWSLYAFLHHPDDYHEAICTAIAVGGDVDTTAAMTGAIAGAHLGLGAIPAGPAGRLNDQGTWTHADLVGLADEVADLTTDRHRGEPTEG